MFLGGIIDDQIVPSPSTGLRRRRLRYAELMHRSVRSV